MAERDTGLLAPWDIKSKAEKFAKDLRVAEDTNYDQTDNKYDAIRHIGGSLALYAQYPDLASDAILAVKEYVFGAGDPKGQKMDLHNNEIGKKLYEMLDEEQADNLTTEQALEIAKSYVEEWDLAEKEGREIDLPEEMKPLMYYGATKEPGEKAEEKDGGLYTIGPEGTWIEKSKMAKGGIMANKEDDYHPIFDAPMKEDFSTDKAKKMNTQLEDAFRDYFNDSGDRKIAREKYRRVVQEIYKKDPETFREFFQNPNTDSRIEELNSLAFGSNEELPYDEDLGDALPTKLNIPFGSEGDAFLGGRTGTRGVVFKGVDEINVAGDPDPKQKDYVTRHEGMHLLNKMEGADNIFMDKGVSDELLVRAFDYVRGLVENDEKLTKQAAEFFTDRTSISPKDAVQIVVNSLPQLYERGVFDKDKTTLDTAQEVITSIDEDEQGFFSSLFGNDPEPVETPIAEFPPTYKIGKSKDVEKLKKLLSIIPHATNIEKTPYDQKVTIDRESVGMNAGGLMQDPLTLSETAEEEAEPKMGIGEYAEGVKEVVEDFSPAGTAQSMIDAAEEAYKLATGSEDASFLDLGIAAMGALPGGKTASKVVENVAKVTDDVVEASQGISKLDNYVPKSTVTAYKLVKEKNGKFYPLFVAQGKEKSDFPVGEWIKAEAGELSPKGKVKSSIGELAYRPGFHAGDLPIATHIGGKSSKAATKPDYRPDDQVWVEIEMANDVDWGSEALKRAEKTKDGRIKSVTAHITDMVPHGGHYRYKTNPNMTGEWLIGGEMKVTRVLSDDEVKKINEAAGVADLPRKSELQKDTSGLMSDAYNRAEQ